MDELEQRSDRRRPRWPLVVLALVVAGAALAYGLLKPAPAPKAAAGNDVPEFSLQRLDGKGRVTSDDLEGSPVVLNFWGSWCGPCADEVPLFEKAWQRYRDKGLTVLGVDLRDTPDAATAFVRKHHVTYPIVTDPGEKLARALDVVDLPVTFFVGADGRFQPVGGGSGTVVLGAISEELLNDEIGELLDAAR